MADNKTIIHCCVDKQVHDLLVAHCERTGQTKTTAVKRAILAYCKENGVEDAEQAREILEGGHAVP